MMNHNRRASFTLIELLIVIAIVAVLSVVVLLVINPAEMLRQARDSTRLANMDTLARAVSLYEVQALTTSPGNASTTYFSLVDPTATTTAGTNCAGIPLTPPTGWNYHCAASSTLKKVDGTGWLPANFDSIPARPLASLPVDPVNTSSSGQYYSYTPGGSFELTAALESAKYGLGGTNDRLSTDGGDSFGLFETGSDTRLNRVDYGDAYLTGWWRFDEGSGTAARDSSRFNHSGTLGGTSTPAWSTDCRSGGCINFNGNYVQIPSAGFSGANGHTMMAWFRPTALAGGTNIFMSYGLPYISFHSGSGNVGVHSVYLSATQRTAYGATVISAGNWYHLAGVYDNGRVLVYLNGNLDGTASYSGSDSISSTLCIGAHSCNSYWSYGTVDEVRTYSRPLSGAEIKAIYDATK